VLGGIWEIAFCASPVRALLGQVMASVSAPGRPRTRSLPTPSFEHLGSAPGSTHPSGEGVAAAVMALTAAPFKQDIDLLIEGLQLAGQRPGHFSSF
jgi:hypothetical protein